MGICVNCAHKGTCTLVSYYEAQGEHIVKCGKRKPQTNYDLLISKTMEELVEWIESIEPAACPWRDDHGDNCCFAHCRDCWLSWLKSPAEEGEG